VIFKNYWVLFLALRAVEVASIYLKTDDNQPCDTKYQADSWEQIVLALSLLTEAWITEILRRKTRDGHCWTHKGKTGPPCPIGSRFHKQLRDDCISDLERMLELIKCMSIQLVPNNR